MTTHDSSTGKSPHAFMVEALEAKAHLLEHRHSFLAAALRAEADALASAKGYSVVDIDRYFDAVAAERVATKPSLRTWRK
jgi:hypothetical protein